MNDDEVITVRIPKYALTAEYDEVEYKLAHLILDDTIFCNNGWWYEKEGKPWQKDRTTLHVNCNDVFYWGCADAENICHGEIGDLYEMWKKDPMWGAAAWCIKKRKQMPQGPVADRMTKAGWDLQELIK